MTVALNAGASARLSDNETHALVRDLACAFAPPTRLVFALTSPSLDDDAPVDGENDSARSGGRRLDPAAAAEQAEQRLRARFGLPARARVLTPQLATRHNATFHALLLGAFARSGVIVTEVVVVDGCRDDVWRARIADTTRGATIDARTDEAPPSTRVRRSVAYCCLPGPRDERPRRSTPGV